MHLQDISYKVTFVEYDIIDKKYTKYLSRKDTSHGLTFQIRDRFSSIRAFQSAIKKKIPVRTSIPDFPSKKYVGNLQDRYIRIRAKNLTMFLNMFLSVASVRANHMLYLYFRDKAYGQASEETVKQLVSNIEFEGETMPWNDETLRSSILTLPSPKNQAMNLLKVEKQGNGEA